MKLTLISIILLSSNLFLTQDLIEGKVITQDDFPLMGSINLLKVQGRIIDYTISDFDGNFYFTNKSIEGIS